MRQQAFGAVHPIVAAGDQGDEVEEAVQALRGLFAPRGARGSHHGLRLQAFEPGVERVFLGAEELEAGPQDQAEGGAGKEEEEEVGQHRGGLIP